MSASNTEQPLDRDAFVARFREDEGARKARAGSRSGFDSPIDAVDRAVPE